MLKNKLFAISPSDKNGGLASLVLNNDSDHMNWIEGTGTWGVPFGFEFVRMEKNGNSVTAYYKRDTLLVTAVRTMENNLLRERYSFRNSGTFDLYFLRGDIGLYANFSDDYDCSPVCITSRCNAHIWSGGENSYIHALKMAPFHTELALVLTKGSLDSYSIRRRQDNPSVDRGDFLLHPKPFHLLPGETRELEWIVTAFPRGKFKETMLAQPNGVFISFEQETIFSGESFHIRLECSKTAPHQVSCNGCILKTVPSENGFSAEYTPSTPGEYRFEFEVAGRRFHALGLCVEDFDSLLEKRIHFILSKQQMLDPRSPLYGAFLIYDNEDQSQYFSYRTLDHNANRERTNIGLLLCRYLQTHRNPAAEHALDLYENFLLREIYDTETGGVFCNIGRSTEVKRLYNNAGMVNFWLEMYRLKKDEKYLTWMSRSIRLYYQNDGYRFYPNGSLYSDVVAAMREAGRTGEADELDAMIKKHVDQICRLGYNYPPHEVNFEQTIATPAVAIPAAYALFSKRELTIVEEVKRQIELLELFQGDQPDYHLHEIAIRHWDGFWFGKRRLYGDTFPHYLSALTARAFHLYARLSGDTSYDDRARRCLRNCLCLFFPDGSASAAYLYPYSITMINEDGSDCTPPRRGEYYDPWANDQDGALYLALTLGGKEFLTGKPS